MGLTFFWTFSAKIEMKAIYLFLKSVAGKEVAKKITDSIFNEAKILKTNEKLGKIEDDLTNKNREYRSLIYTNYKIIYWINIEENQIEITDIFDIRQEPIKIKRTK